MSPRRLQAAGLVLGLIALGLVLASATLIDRRAPTVERILLSRTVGNERVALTHAAIDVVFSEPVQRSTAQVRFRIQPAVDGSFAWDGARTLIFTPDPKFPTATEFTVFVEPGFSDVAGNVNETPSERFTFRTVGLPVLASTAPANGSEAVPLEEPIRLTFDRLMDVELTERALRIEPAARYRATWSATTLILTPTEPLAPGTRYRVELGAEAADTDGNGLARPISLSFTTVALGLGVTSVLPADGSAGAPLGGPIAIVFDAPVDERSIAQSVRLTPPASGQLRVVPLPSDSAGAATAAPRVLLFVPDAPLAPHTTYTAQLRAATVRAAGTSNVASGRTWSFTTGSQLEVLQNQVLFLAARGGVQNLWVMNPNGSNPRQLTSELAPVTSYDVAGDGRTVVYAAAGAVRQLSLPGGRVATLTAPEDAEYAPRLLPDGSALILGRRDRASGRDEGIWLVPLRDEGPARALLPAGAPPLGSASAPGTLPDLDGRPTPWTALAGVSPDSGTALVPGVGRELTRVRLADGTTSLTGLRDPMGPVSWAASRGGFLVAARRSRDGVAGSWFVHSLGPPTPGPALAAWPATTGRGATVAVSGAPPTRLEYRSSWFAEPVALTAGTDLLDRQPAFSPGGEAVLFVRVLRAAPERSAGIWLVRVDRSGLRQLTPDGSDPRWLP